MIWKIFFLSPSLSERKDQQAGVLLNHLNHSILNNNLVSLNLF